MKLSHSFVRLAALVLLSVSAAACGSHAEPKTPDGFVELEEDEDYSGYVYRAVSADGVVLGLRELEHKPKGNLDFWTKVIENELRERGGYALLSKKDVKGQAGLPGRQLRFGHDEGETPYGYILTLFVTDSTIYVLEFGGPKDLLEKQNASLDAAVAGFAAK